MLFFASNRPGFGGNDLYISRRHNKRNDLGWQPSVTFEEGLRRTVAWYLDHMDWVSHVRSGEYRHWISLQYGSREPTQ
jgi:dTDP-glucose 4,6-dehydratase